ncbi:hypothetical protein DM01DRAFT_1341090 [Hesseltinella vesiculosa]|uniref:Tetratricopeptide repeat protein 7 N-terminal domain-containing protein n=1 Tax=Hesseltinella vesiculosa TaxID=101127 RepID=A0A1X2G239_9FUNG|nr:hypothetical protein DM01DRAFT_1341090 [Hesseltinella vesiculosa]
MLFVNSTKTAHIVQELDSARCRGHWHLVPDLVKRYIKHNPQGVEWEQLIMAEVQLVQIVKTHPPLKPQQMHAIKTQLNSMLSDPSISVQVKEYAKVVLARLLYVSKEYGQALDMVSNSHLDTQVDGYTLILSMQAKALQAMCLEQSGDLHASLTSYDSLASLLLNCPIPVQDTMVLDWLEQALYRGCKLVLGQKQCSQINATQQKQLLLCYHHITSHQPFSWHLTHRRELTEALICHVSAAFELNEDRPLLLQLYTIYEKLVNKSDDPQDIIKFVDLLSHDLPRLVTCADDLRGFKQVVERASEFNLQSPSLLRHRFTALFYLGEYQEAHHVLLAYLDLCCLLDLSAWKDDQDFGHARLHDSQGRAISEPRHSDTSEAIRKKKSSSALLQQPESLTHQASVLVLAVKLYDCMEQVKSAVEMANLGLSLLERTADSRHEELSDTVIADVYRHAGSAYGWMAAQTFSSQDRVLYHDKALGYLKSAVTRAPESWQAHYQLGLQYARMRNIDQAVRYARHALQFAPSHLPSWHLLILALSTSDQQVKVNGETLMTMAQAALAQYTYVTDTSLDRFSMAALEQQHTQRLFLSITLNRLLYQCNGPREALNQHPDLFATYGQWCQQHLGSAITVDPPYTSSHLATASSASFLTSWHHFDTTAPKPPTNYGWQFGNLAPSLLAPHFAPSSTSSMMVTPSASTNSISSAMTTTTVKTTPAVPAPTPLPPASSLRRRSASSDMIEQNRPQQYATDAYLSPTPGNSASPDSRLAKRASSLRKHSSNSMLKTNHYWQGLFPSRSTSRRSIFFTASSSTSQSSSPIPSVGRSDPAFLPVSTSTTPSITDDSLPFISLLQPTRPEQISTHMNLQCQRQRKWLVRLWLLAADMYIALDKHDDAIQAIFEAECVAPGNADLWCQLAATNPNHISAMRAYNKGLLVDVHHVGCQVGLAKIHIEQGEGCLAQGLLESVTQGPGWSTPEAWFCLGSLYQQNSMLEMAKSCLLYALELQSTEPIQPFEHLPRVC